MSNSQGTPGLLRDIWAHVLLALAFYVLHRVIPHQWEPFVEFVFLAWILTVVVTISKSRHAIFLWDIGRSSSVSRLLGLRPIAIAGQRKLGDQYRQFQARFVALVSSGLLKDATYHEQMVFAGLLYGQHSERLWATSMDPWSDYLRTNESYSRLMSSKGDDLPYLNEDGWSDTSGVPPARARVFVLPVDRFVKDVVKDPSAARELVRVHLYQWRCYPRLMLVSPRGTGLTAEPVSAIWSEMMKCCVQPLSAVPTLSIADFMLVDSAFVYGRVEPEVLEDAVPLLRARFTLGFSESGVDVLAYKNLFESVWTASVSLQRLGDEIWPAEHKVPSPGHASAELAREALMSLSEQEVTKFRSLVENASVDITDFLDAAERDVRYQSFFLSDDSPLGKMFLAKMRAAVGPCFAIDQADLKKDNGDDRRFCEKWRKNEAYSAWSAAFAAKKGQLRRRIFVLRDWNLADEPQLVAFLMDEVDQKGVEVGLVLQSELKRFAESTRGLDAAVHDAEWIVVDAHAASGRPEVGPQTMGVSFGPAKIEADINSKSAVKVGKEDLKCKRLMDTYLKWHERIWQDPEIDLERLTDASQVQAFIRTLPSRLSEASPSEHRVGANPS